MNIGIIGVGNAGNQVAALAAEKLGIDAIAINSSQKDLDTLTGSKITKILIGDSLGAGKNRTEAKKFIKANSGKVMNSPEVISFMGTRNADGKFVSEKDFVFVVSSTGGGTGSGAVPVYAELLKHFFDSVNFIVVGILPSLKEALSTQANTLEYLKELYDSTSGIPYMLYDNESRGDCSTNVMMESVNEAIVDDIETISGARQLSTKYASIDEKDMTAVLTAPGRIIVAKAVGITEKQLDSSTIDDFLVKDLKKNCHAETNRDKIVNRLAVISLLDSEVSASFNDQLPKVQEFIGVPVETFNHFSVKEDDMREVPNAVYIIASGLSRIDDRIQRIVDRVDEINAAQEKAKHAQDTLSSVDIDALNAKRTSVHSGDSDPSQLDVDLDVLFNKFGV